MQFFREPLESVLPYANLVFGNEAEAETFSEVFGFGTTDRKEIAKRIAQMPLKGHKSRIVVITQVRDPTSLFIWFSLYSLSKTAIFTGSGRRVDCGRTRGSEGN